jgi:hypothetical protein
MKHANKVYGPARDLSLEIRLGCDQPARRVVRRIAVVIGVYVVS